MIGSVEPMKALHADWGAHVHFVDVLVRQGHPGPQAPPYRSLDDKLESAARYKSDEQLPWEVAVDDLEGTVHAAYGLLADPSYLVGIDGRVAFYGCWTHVPTLRTAIEALMTRGGAGVVGSQRTLHPLAAVADGWRAIERGLPQSFTDLETALPGLGIGLWAGSAVGPVLAPIALTSHPWPRPAAKGLAIGVAVGAVIAWTLLRPVARARWRSRAVEA